MALRRIPRRTGRRVGDTFVADTPAYTKTLVIIDAAINIAPNLDGRRDIGQKALKPRTQFDLETPRAVIPSALLLSAANAARTRLVFRVAALTPADARRHSAAVQSS
ncbi:hypothetical protein [Rhizobium sp. BR 362]|uniref:hypothetical protein n=1 Tax=Rhizobium sp. BR 362 TaxID=3040670 RepID=UPI002F3F69BD